MLLSSELDTFERLHKRVLENIFHEDTKMEPHDLSMALLYISMIDKARGIEILLSKNVLDSVKIIQRSMLEQYVYLLFILKSDTVKRGRAYFYGNKISGIKYWNNLKRDYSDKELTNKISSDLDNEISKKGYWDGYDNYSDYYREKYNSLFEKGVKDKRQWFNIYGDTNTICALFKKMNMLDEYRFIYAANSESTHGTNMPEYLKASEDGFTVSQSIDDLNMDSFIIGDLYLGMEGLINYYKYVTISENISDFEDMEKVVKRYLKRKYKINLKIEN